MYPFSVVYLGGELPSMTFDKIWSSLHEQNLLEANHHILQLLWLENPHMINNSQLKITFAWNLGKGFFLLLLEKMLRGFEVWGFCNRKRICTSISQLGWMPGRNFP